MRSSKVTKYFAAFAVTLLAIVLAGCGSGNKEGAGVSTSGSALFGNVATVGDTACIQCHSATTEKLTGETIVSQYQQNSPHNQDGLGCESCHGGGAMHNGVGPIPYPTPDADRCATCHNGETVVAGKTAPATNSATDFSTSVHATGNAGTGAVTESDNGEPCVRCHSNQGGILGAKYGFTGDRTLMDNPNYEGAVPLATEYTAITCETCHEHGAGLRVVKSRGTDGSLISWNPSGSGKANDQFNLCTSCHGLKTNDGTIMASGNTVWNTDLTGAATAGTTTTKVGHHETSWYRVIATTHLDNPDNTAYGITGYVLRTNGKSACFDCHGHESRTDSRYVTDPTKATIYTDWAQSGHAGDLLANKLIAATGTSGTAQVDAMMNGSSKTQAFGGEGVGSHDFSSAGSQACQRCHTATGASNYLDNPSAYVAANNDFTHLSGWSFPRSTQLAADTEKSNQRELLYCWSCHSNAGKGVVRNPGAFTADYKFQGVAAKFPDVAESNTCITCHSGRESGESLDAITDFTNVSFKNSHYMAAAGLMYVKEGFIGFVDPNTVIGTSTYGKSLTSTDDGGAVGSTHRVFGTSAIIGNHGITASDTNMVEGGPCVTCHMNSGGGKAKHSLKMDAYAYDNVCVKCHTSEGSKAGAVALDSANYVTAFLEPQAEGFNSALDLALIELKKNFNIEYDGAAYPYFFKGGLAHTNANAVKDWTLGGTVDGKKLMGACFNINLLKREPAAYAHARTYSRRLLYDTIDWLDNQTIDLSVSATAVVDDAAEFAKGTTAYSVPLTTIDPGTSEGMLFLLNWNRTSGAWNTPERP